MAKGEAEGGQQSVAKEKCGIVMPISALDGCDEGHWINVRDIFNEAIMAAGYQPNLVSLSDEVGVIQKTIVQNLYDNPIVVCDVSGKNPNVMLELGLRLAFDKPVIIVKDDKTSYPFDTSPIEHLGYPRDLRYQSILEFKSNLTKKIEATVAAARNGGHSTFLRHFGEFKVAKIETKEVGPNEFLADQIQEIKELLRALAIRSNQALPAARSLARQFAEKAIEGADPAALSSAGVVADVSARLSEHFDLGSSLAQQIAHQAVAEVLAHYNGPRTRKPS